MAGLSKLGVSGGRLGHSPTVTNRGSLSKGYMSQKENNFLWKTFNGGKGVWVLELGEVIGVPEMGMWVRIRECFVCSRINVLELLMGHKWG